MMRAVEIIYILISISMITSSTFGQTQETSDFFDETIGRFLLLPRLIQGNEANLSSRGDDNYTYTSWSDFSDCDKVCGGGHFFRSRRCVDQNGDEHPVIRCSQNADTSAKNLLAGFTQFLNGQHYFSEVETKRCNISPCQVSTWTDWSICSSPCGGGFQVATRTCVNSPDKDLCNFQSVKSRRCNTENCYRVGEWGAWDHCTRYCNGGTQSRARGCVPNLQQSHPAYRDLADILLHVSSFVSYRTRLSSRFLRSKLLYLNEYRKTCTVQLRQKRKCNTWMCPECPSNQVYHHCKPCTTRCPLISSNQLAIPSFLTIVRKFYRCTETCDRGCGCPISRPYLGSDQTCYLIPNLCPINQVNGRAGYHSPVIGLNSQATNGLPTSLSRSIISATTSPTTTSQNESNPEEFEPCEYNTLIETSDGNPSCRCDGKWISFKCRESECLGSCQEHTLI